MFLRYRLGDAFCGRNTVFFHRSGGFEVAQGRLLEYMAGFRSLRVSGRGTQAKPTRGVVEPIR